ncbi:thyroglobulin-like [Bombyx mori]|uniref:thyroglobulin-like n=1 Tax=Bombyx mori TaxID=7091 RepID=UPI000640B34D
MINGGTNKCIFFLLFKMYFINTHLSRTWIVLALCFYWFCVVNSQCQVAQTCVHDATVSDCLAGEVLAPNVHIFNCCPACRLPGPTDPGDGTECKPPSSCLPDGSFGPVQCKGDMFTGRCFCSDKDGNRIFGQMWRNEASDMSCACSRRRAEIEASGRKFVTLHCTGNGDYEPLQCDDGLCWCANVKTGQPTVTPVPQEDMKRLPCYSAGVAGEQYLRRCESLVQSMATINQEQAEHGTKFFGNPTTFCAYDGSYGPFQIRNGVAYCTGRDGEILGSWQVISSEMSRMNCNCARDTMIYFPERGMTVTEICLANGNYQPHQNVGDVYYCVDTDGYPIEFLDEWPSDRCASYA